MNKVLIPLAIVCLILISCAPAPKPPPVVLQPKDNRPPVATAIVGSAELKPSSSITLTCAATDPDSDKLIYTWSAAGGSITGNGMQATWTAPAGAGEVAVTCVVTDGRGGEASITRNFKVTDNPFNNQTVDQTVYLELTLPSAQAVEVSKQIRSFYTREIECKLLNQVQGKLKYKWEAPVGKLTAYGLNEGTATRVGWTAPGAAGNYTVSVTVTDMGGNQAKGVVTFEVLCCKDPVSW